MRRLDQPVPKYVNIADITRLSCEFSNPLGNGRLGPAYVVSVSNATFLGLSDGFQTIVHCSGRIDRQTGRNWDFHQQRTFVSRRLFGRVLWPAPSVLADIIAAAPQTFWGCSGWQIKSVVTLCRRRRAIGLDPGGRSSRTVLSRYVSCVALWGVLHVIRPDSRAI